GVNTTLDWTQTLKAEGRAPDSVYRINVPDSAAEAVLMEAAAQRNKPTWNWEPTNSNETNCATAAMSTLFKGRVRALLPGSMPPFTPNNFDDSMRRLAGKGGTVTKLPNVPW